jgi:hemerythrin
MPLVTWNDSLKTGNATVDKQHLELIGLVNNLHEALLAGKGKEQIGATLEGLAKYTTTHFQTEELLMARSVYPGMAVHKAKHEDLLKQAGALIADHKAGKPVLSITVSQFLADWVRHHIDAEDKALAAYLAKKQ